uniref:CARD domain-containing protein n=1 Tax=Seriola dumerili TaxID=41447 RepID=A0A3B4UBM6_SERDU
VPYTSGPKKERKHNSPFLTFTLRTLIWSVTNITPVLDGLFSCDVINKESYDEIMSIPSSMQKMRALFNWHLDSSGDLGKNTLFTILEAHEPVLMTDLKKKEHENIASVNSIGE